MYGPFPPLRDSVFHLEDPRALAFAEWGALEGRPVVLFHGSPGGCLFSPDPDVTASMGVRLITSIGRDKAARTRDRALTLEHWTRDVEELLDHLGISSVGLVGFSGGSKFALACAALMPDRIDAAALVAGGIASFDEWPEGYDDEEDRDLALLIRKDRERAVEVAFAANGANRAL